MTHHGADVANNVVSDMRELVNSATIVGIENLVFTQDQHRLEMTHHHSTLSRK